MLKLIRPCEDYLASYSEAIREDAELRPEAERIFDDADAILLNAYKAERGIDVAPGYASETILWLVDETHFIGEVGIRHTLTPELLRYGGHIGYEIRCSECRKGYGTRLLAMALPYCRDVLGLRRVLITCDDDNIGSRRIIEANGGVLENKVVNVIDRGTILTRRYWIDL